MQAVILAAGKGVRMGKLTESTPKPMLEIKGKPILAYKIEALPKEINQVILIVGYLKDQIKDFFGNNYDGRKITYVEQKELNGTAGAVYAAKDILKEKFLVVSGDDLYSKDDMRRIMGYDLAILGYKVSNPRLYGIIKTDESGNLIEVVEKPDIDGPQFANVGLYMLNEEFFKYPPVSVGKGEIGLPQVLAQMSDKHNIKIEKATCWLPIGNPQDYEKAKILIDKFI